MNWIFDTLWEFWQYMKPNRIVYLAGKYHNGKLMLIRMIPEALPMGNGWEQLTQPMPEKEALQRANMFPLYRVVEKAKLSEIGT